MLSIKVKQTFQNLILISTLTIVSCASGIGTSPTATVSGMPNQGSLGKTMIKNQGKFEYCARDSVTIQTGAVQKLKLNFIVNPDGTASKIHVDGMSDPDPDLQLCLVKAVNSIHFPKPTDQKPKPVSYPITLQSEQ